MGGTTHEQLYDAFGAYVRSQRQLARLTLRQAAELASISNPYLSQIEHGLVLPSIGVLGSLAKALSVSAETMLLRAAGVARTSPAERSYQTEDSIRQDSRLTNSQKLALLAVLSSFVGPSSVPSHSDASSSGVVPDKSAQVVARRGISTSTSAGPAAAGQAAGPRKGV